MGDYDWHIPTDTNTWSDQLFRIYGHEPQSFHAVLREVPVADPPRRPGADHRPAPAGLRDRRALPDDRAHRAARRRGAVPLLQRRGDHGRRRARRCGCAAPASTSPTGCSPTSSGPGSRRGSRAWWSRRPTPSSCSTRSSRSSSATRGPGRCSAETRRGTASRRSCPAGHTTERAESAATGLDGRDLVLDVITTTVNPEDGTPSDPFVAVYLRDAGPRLRERGDRLPARRGAPASPPGTRDQRQRRPGAGGCGVRPRAGTDTHAPWPTSTRPWVRPGR